MKIAYFVPYAPNLIRVRSYQLITRLSMLGAEVTVFTVASNDQDLEDVRALRLICHDVIYQDQPLWRSFLMCLAALPTKKPLQAVYSWHPGLLKKFLRIHGDGLRSHFDLVHVEHLRGSTYAMQVKSTLPNLPVVWDSVDCISHLFELTSAQSSSLFGKLISMIELKKTRQWERKLTSLFEDITITSQGDKNALLNLALGSSLSPISVLPNGVDMEYFRPGHEFNREPETIVFSGKMSYHANISMVDFLVCEIMPKVWVKHPCAQLVIVGKDPPAKIKNYARNPLVKVTGTVADIRPYLQHATVAAVPLVYGVGIQNKILEAMACKTPVVTNSTAMSALQAEAGRDILVANSSEEFSNELLRVIENPSLQRELGHAGFEYVKNNHDWNKIAKELMMIYTEVIRKQPRRSFV